MWDMSALSVIPAVWDAAPSGAEDVRALFFEGLPWRGRPTRIFAYYGIPEHATGERVPGMGL